MKTKFILLIAVFVVLLSSFMMIGISSIVVDKLTANNSIITDTTFADQINLSLLSSPAHQEGRVFYNTDDKTLSYYNEVSGTEVNIAQEFIVRVKNTTGVQINDGQAVYINGAVGVSGVPTIALAKADASSTAAMLGLATHNIANNGFGYITACGKVRGINTSAFASGDLLYLSATTAGAVTNTAPLSPNYETGVGVCINSHAVQGTILVFREAPKLGL